MAERLRASARVRLRSDPSALVGDHPPTLEPHCWTGRWPRRCAKGLASNVALLHHFDTLAAWRSACAPQHACGCVQIRPHLLAIILRPWSRTVGLADGPGRARKVLQTMSHFCITFDTLAAWRSACAPQHARCCVQIRSHGLVTIPTHWCRTVGFADGPRGARKVLQAMSHFCTPLTLWQRGGAPARLSTRAAAFRSVRIGWRSSSDLGAALLDWQMAQDVRERSCKQCRTFAHL